MGSKGVKNALSKRRPRQNIISLILKNAKAKSQHSTGSTSASSTSRSSDGMSARREGGDPPADGGKDSRRGSVRRRGASRSRGIIKSAVELTRRSKRMASRSSSRRGSSRKSIPFVKGQRAFYRSSKGISKVTVVGIHHDSKLEPYYTIRLRDGKEKQTDGKHLTPIQEDAKKSSAETSSEGKIERRGSGDSAKTNDRSRDRSSSGRRDRDGAVSGSASTDGLTDFSTEAEKETEDEVVIDYTEEGEEEEEEEKHEAKPRRDRDSPRKRRGTVESHASRGNNDSDEEDSDDEEGEGDGGKRKRFNAGQDAYYRSPSGSVSKISVLSYWEGTDRYTISLPDGSHRNNVKPSRLATLMELTSKELSMLMKERNKRQGGGSGGKKERRFSNSLPADRGSRSKERRPSSSSKGSAHTEPSVEDENTEEDAVDEGYEAGEGEPVSSGSEQSTNDLSNDLTNSPISTNDKPTSSTKEKLLELPAPPPEVKMVEAMTEDGGTKTVPLYESGMEVFYKNAAGVQGCTILSVHLDDLLEPYYDVRLEDGKEKQTDNAHIMLTLALEDGNADDQDEAREVGEGEVLAIEAAKGEESQDEEDHKPVSADKFIEVQEQPLTDSVPKKRLDVDSSDRSNDPSSGSKAQTDATAALMPVAQFCAGDEVQYTSSQGDSTLAIVVRLHRDKKNRPYYVIRLPKGKEKQVYGHRLKPYDPKDREGRRARSRSRSGRRSGSKGSRSGSRGSKDGRRRGRSKASSRGRHGDPPMRSDSMDSRKSSQSHMSNSSRRSRASRERHAAREESLASSRDGYTKEESLASSRTGRRERHDRHHRDESVASSRRGRERDESIASSRRGRTRDESLASNRTRDESLASARDRHAGDPSGRRGRSKSAVRRSSSHVSSSHHHGEERGRGRRAGRSQSRSRAPSEDSRVSSSSHHHHASSHHRSKRSTPSVSMSSRRASEAQGSNHSSGGDDHSKSTSGTTHAGKSIAKLRSFRKGFAAMRKSSQRD